jgi:hypothetical protein
MAGAAFAQALSDFLAEEPPPPDEALRRMARTRRLAIELQRPLVMGAASWREKWALADQKSAEYNRWARDLQTHIDALHARPGYRVEQGLKRLLRRR